MSELITTAPIRTRHRASVIVVGLFAALALVVGVAVALVSSGSTESSPRRSTAPNGHERAEAPIQANDISQLLAALVALPAGTQAQVMASLSPDLRNGLGNLVQYVEPSRLPPAPDSTTLGTILARLDAADREVIVSALPSAQTAAVIAAVQLETATCPAAETTGLRRGVLVPEGYGALSPWLVSGAETPGAEFLTALGLGC